MHFRCLLVVALWLGMLAASWAELRIGAGLDRKRFMLFEPIDLKVAVDNNSEMQVLLHGQPGRPWLRFLVSTLDGKPVRQDRGRDFSELLVEPGQRRGVSVNITPLYSIRQPGEYTVRAVLSVPGHADVISDPVYFEVRNGTQLWTDNRPAEGSLRTYSLHRFQPDQTSSKLYLQVTDKKLNRVYGTVPLGNTTHVMPPQTHWDKHNELHVLHTVGLGHYRYFRFDTNGRMRARQNYESTPTYPPRLYRHTDGMVQVVGGRLITRAARPKLSETKFGEERMVDERAAPVQASVEGPSDADLPPGQRASQDPQMEAVMEQARRMQQQQLQRPTNTADLMWGEIESEDEALPNR